ncbi:MAG: 6-carboxyhexanoate--CoA ligase, partial [Selenomonadaceae bacterium]|nr:6-carboxyhexanoate--CoA ligase [Selenomonadaceae bacterium]
MLYSLKMRASQSNNHISGAERILNEEELTENISALVNRALHHSKGQPDFVNLKIETIAEDEIKFIDALPIKTIEVDDALSGRKIIVDLLKEIGIDNAVEIMQMISKTYKMRGAMLLNVDTLERLESDQNRGIRATFMDSVEKSTSDQKNHFREAIVLASKVVNAPGIVAEICISDDPNYVTGYIASKSIGYVRITKLKEFGCNDGGRIFLYRGNNEDVAECINYLERQKVLVKNVPADPLNEIPTKNIFQSIENNLNDLKKNQLYRTMQTIESASSDHVEINGESYLMLASNNYLGLIDDQRVKSAAIKAIENYGSGSGGSRLTTGNLKLHEDLEKNLADFKGTDKAILFNTGYMANVGTISAIGKICNVIFSDELNHASIIDGCRLSRSKVVIYKHNDMNDLESKIKSLPITNYPLPIIITDAVFSMDGDICNLPDLLSIARKNNCLLMVDEAHSTGVIGENGHGIVEYFNLNEKPDILMGTLSKSLASEGGFVCGNELLIDYLKNNARSFIFSTSLAPATIAAANEALKILREEPERVKRLQSNVKYFCSELKNFGVNVDTQSAIVPIIIGDEESAL